MHFNTDVDFNPRAQSATVRLIEERRVIIFREKFHGGYILCARIGAHVFARVRFCAKAVTKAKGWRFPTRNTIHH